MWVEYTYDKEARALYLYLYNRDKKRIGVVSSKVVKTSSLDALVNADFNFRGETIGVEVLDVEGIREAKDEDRDNPE